MRLRNFIFLALAFAGLVSSLQNVEQQNNSYQKYSVQEINSYNRYLNEFKDSSFAQLYTIDAFYENMAEMTAHNFEKNVRKSHTYTKDINQFSGISPDKAMELLKLNQLSDALRCPTDAELFNSDFPIIETSWDWRAQQVSSLVHD